MTSDPLLSQPAVAERPFYLTGLSPCPYLAGREERRLVTFLDGPDATAVLDRLNLAGFRRSQRMAYRPMCPSCAACLPVRIPVADFRPDRTMRRIAARNAHVEAVERPKLATREQYALFRAYLEGRHADGGMVDMRFADYVRMVEDDPVEGGVVEFREEDRLIGVCLTDRLGDGLSGVYTFFDPALQKRSLGTMIILRLVEQARAEARPYVYLGYWIAGSRKMAYKTRFEPLERLTGNGWERFGAPKSA